MPAFKRGFNYSRSSLENDFLNVIPNLKYLRFIIVYRALRAMRILTMLICLRSTFTGSRFHPESLLFWHSITISGAPFSLAENSWFWKASFSVANHTWVVDWYLHSSLSSPPQLTNKYQNFLSFWFQESVVLNMFPPEIGYEVLIVCWIKNSMKYLLSGHHHSPH